MNVRALIVDDDEYSRRSIRALLREDAEVDVIGECGSGAEAVSVIRGQRPDLVFLEVRLPGMNGFQLLEEVGAEIAPAAVFVTGDDHYALRAFDVQAVDFLLKPFDDERFFESLKRVKEYLSREEAVRLRSRLQSLLEEFRDNSPTGASCRFLERLVVRSAGRVAFLKTAEVDWIEAANYYVRLHSGGQAHLLRESMGALEEKLDPEHFLRIHRSTIVNLERVSELRTQPNGDYLVVLVDGTQLKLSRSRRDRVTEVLGM